MTEETTSTVDYSAYTNEDGTLNTGAIDGVLTKLENAEKSSRYFQSQYSKSTQDSLPDDDTGYGEGFKADSSYAKFMGTDEAQKEITALKAWAKENGIGKNTYNKMQDYALRGMLSRGTWETRTQEQIEAEEYKATEEAKKTVQPMLENLGRTFDENTALLKAFANSDNVFTNNPKMKEYFEKIADDGAQGYMFATLLTQAVNHSGVPSVNIPTASAIIDRAALDEALAKETDPNRREAMTREYYRGMGIEL